MWFTEAAWPPIIGVLTLAGIAGFLWWERRQPRYLLIAAFGIVAAVAIWLVERSIVTPRERVEQSIYDITAAFERQDADGVLDAISERSPELRLFASWAVSTVKLSSPRVTDVSVELVGAEKFRARSHFRVNGMVTSKQFDAGGHQATRWDVTWENEGDRWRILDVVQLDPLTGEPTSQFRHMARNHGLLSPAGQAKPDNVSD